MKQITITRACGVEGKHRDPGDVLAVPGDVRVEDADYLVASKSALEGDFSEFFTGAAGATAGAAPAGKRGRKPGGKNKPAAVPSADTADTGDNAGDDTGDDTGDNAGDNAGGAE